MYLIKHRPLQGTQVFKGHGFFAHPLPRPDAFKARLCRGCKIHKHVRPSTPTLLVQQDQLLYRASFYIRESPYFNSHTHESEGAVDVTLGDF